MFIFLGEFLSDFLLILHSWKMYTLFEDERRKEPTAMGPMKRKENGSEPNLHEDMFHVNLQGCNVGDFL